MSKIKLTEVFSLQWVSCMLVVLLLVSICPVAAADDWGWWKPDEIKTPCITPPADMEIKPWVIWRSHPFNLEMLLYGNYTCSKDTLNVGFAGDTVYIQGLHSRLDDWWVKGKVEGNRITIPDGLVVGSWVKRSGGYYDILGEKDIIFQTCFSYCKEDYYDVGKFTRTWWLEREYEDMTLEYDAVKGEIYKLSSSSFWIGPSGEYVYIGEGSHINPTPYDYYEYTDDLQEIYSDAFLCDMRPEREEEITKPEILIRRMYQGNDENRKVGSRIRIKPYIFDHAPWNDMNPYSYSRKCWIYMDGSSEPWNRFPEILYLIDDLIWIPDDVGQIQVRLIGIGKDGIEYESEMSDPVRNPSGVGETAADVKCEDAAVYDLMGHRVNSGNLQPRIYIRNGKKFMVPH